MPIEGLVPGWLLTVVAVGTIFTIMFDLGLAIVPGEFRWVFEHPGLLLKCLFAVLVAVPALAWLVARAVDLPRDVEIGIVLMAISPGAPVALRRSLGAGGHRAFAPALQIAVAALAVVSMPLAIAAFDEYYAGHATADPLQLARQVFFAQLLPLGLGMLMARAAPRATAWLEPRLRRVGTVLLAVLVALALVNVWKVVIDAGPRVALSIVAITFLALAAGHLLGGPDPATRVATAISSAARNPGLALLVAALNRASPAITATVLAYFVIAALAMIPYVAWRRRSTAPS
ncbi:MAG: bile acid:sodium symporter [Burkholderiales bacterium]